MAILFGQVAILQDRQKDEQEYRQEKEQANGWQAKEKPREPIGRIHHRGNDSLLWIPVRVDATPV